MATVTSPVESPEKSPVPVPPPGEGWPLSTTQALVPQPRSLQEAAKALPFTWLWEEKNEKGELRWLPFRRSDQPRLDAAEGKVRSGESEDIVRVEGGRWKVNLQQRSLQDCYGSDPPKESCRVLRGRWFLISNGTLTPYDEQTDEAIESAYQKLLQRAEMESSEAKPAESYEMSEEVKRAVAEGRPRTILMKLKFKANKWKFTCADQAQTGNSLFSYGKSLLESSYGVQRGFGEIERQLGEVEEEMMSKEIGHVIVLVHGIGEKMWSEEGCGLAWSSGVFRQLVHAKQLRGHGFVKAGDGWEFPGETPPEVKKDEVLEASWWETVQTDEMDARLARISLPSMKQVRQIANFTVVDALYYMHPGHKEKILKAVAKSVESALARFYEHHPDYKGSVVLAGHSLGGVILFELLRTGSPKLSFVPQVLFTMGSPVGLFLHTADSIPNRSFSLPGGTRYFNIFHPLDPVAYRVEPLIAEELEKLDPEWIPCDSDQLNWGGYKTNHALHQMGKTMYTWARGEEKAKNDLLRLIGGVALNAGDRVDWSLQEDMSMWTTVGVAGELMQALPSHSCYMKSPDVAAFIQNHSTKIAVANSLVAKHGPEMFPDASETVSGKGKGSSGTPGMPSPKSAG